MSDAYPTLHTPRLTLRRIQPDDTDAVFALYGDESVVSYLDIETLTTREQAADLVRFFLHRAENNPFAIRWAITLRDQPGLIGTCGYNFVDLDSHWAEIGYDLMPVYWRQGIMSEALREVLRYGFDSANLHRVEAVIEPENQASAQLLERLGFKREGVLRERLLLGGRYRDNVYYGLLRAEYLVGVTV
jgi:ribosomal-protein-alanine N-acetyltransferase